MRRTFILLSALGLLSSVVGCHVAGVCDCDNHVACALGCCGGPIAGPADEVITSVPNGSSQIIHEMPRPVTTIPMAR